MGRVLGSIARRFVSSVIVLISLTFCAQAQVQFADNGFTVDQFAQLPPYNPIGIVWAPDGRAFIWAKQGEVYVWKNGAVLATPFLNIVQQVANGGDRGLVGLALDPDFAHNGYVYVTYTVNDPSLSTKQSTAPTYERLSRFQADPSNPDVALAGSETIILGKIGYVGCTGINQDCLPNDHSEHTIDSLLFGSDGKLYVSVGDGSFSTSTYLDSFRAQNIDSLDGKILRINRDGTGPSDNPFYNGDPNANRSKVYAMGMRNPYRFAQQPGTGEIYLGDVGWNSWEELDHGRGKNFGWPCYEGGLDSSGNTISLPQPLYQQDFASTCASINPAQMTAPAWTYSHNGGGAAIGAQVFYTGNSYPAQYAGNLFITDYNNGWIKRAVFDSNGNLTAIKGFASNVGGPVYMTQGPDGDLYYIEFATGTIWHIQYGKLPVAQASATPTTGLSPLTVAFSSAGSMDPNNGTLSYAWDFGDGTTSTAANPTHTYTSSTRRTFTAKLTVTNTAGSASATVAVTVGNSPPVPVITTPANNTTFHVGDTVNFSGKATDAEDGALPASALNWTVLLHHEDHIHTVMQISGSGGSFVVENHDPTGYFYYEIILSVTDSGGATTTTSVSLPVIQPNGSLQGTVIKAGSTKPIAQAQITAGSYTAISDANGNYVFASLPPGKYSVTAKATGLLMYPLNATISAGSPTTLVIPMSAAGKIAATVVNASGTVLSAQTVTVSGGALNSTFTFTTDSSGKFLTPYIPIGSYTLTVGTVTTSATVNAGATTAVRIVAQSSSTGGGGNGALAGKVTAVGSTAGVANAKVTAGSYSTTTNSNGNYSFASLPAGTYSVNATASGLLCYAKPVSVASGTTTTFNLLMSSAGRISATVLASNGAALANQSVSVIGGALNSSFTFVTDSTGKFVTPYIPKGTYTLSVGSSQTTAQVNAGSTTTVLFKTGTSGGGDSGSTGALQGIVINAATGTPYRSGSVTAGSSTATVATDGSYRFASLPVGTYNVQFSAAGMLSYPQTVTVSVGATATLNLKTSSAGKITGTLTDASGHAVAAATVKIVGGVLGGSYTATTDANGHFATAYIPVGTYTLTAGSASAQVTLTSGQVATVTMKE